MLPLLAATTGDCLMPRNHFQAPGLLVALGLAILFSSTSLSTESHAQVTAKEACSIAMVKATQRAAKCLGLAQIRSIRGGWLAEKLEEHIDRCERKHSRAFRRAERRAESRGAACEADGNDIFAQHQNQIQNLWTYWVKRFLLVLTCYFRGAKPRSE